MGKYLSPYAKRTYANREWFERRVKRGMTVAEIALEVNRNQSGIGMWKFRHGFVSYTTNPKNLSAVARTTYANPVWLADQFSASQGAREIARTVFKTTGVRISTETIRAWKFRLAIPSSTRPRFPPEAKQTYGNRAWLKTQIARGLSDREIAERINPNITKGMVQAARLYFNLKRTAAGKPRREKERLAFGHWLAPRLESLPLSIREQNVLKRFYGIGQAVETSRSIAAPLSVSYQSIDQTVERALAKIAIALGEDTLRTFPAIQEKRLPITPLLVKLVTSYGNRAWLSAQVECGHTVKAIARVAGVSSNAIGQAIKRFGIVYRSPTRHAR